MNKDEMLESILHILERIEARQNKPWVGLTGAEINRIFAANVGYPERMMKDVENLLKEKNGG